MPDKGRADKVPTVLWALLVLVAEAWGMSSACTIRQTQRH